MHHHGQAATTLALIPTEAPSPKTRGRPRKTTSNPHRHHLQDCCGFFKLRYQLPRKMARDLDDIISGVTKLDFGGNQRPISRRLILGMLRDLDEISVESVQDYTGFSLSYSKKLATVMRITANAFGKVVAEDGTHSQIGAQSEVDLNSLEAGAMRTWGWDDHPD